MRSLLSFALYILTMSVVVSSEAEPKPRTEVTEQQQHQQIPSSATSTTGIRVIDLDSRNLSRISDGNTWLLMFYAPWCNHCSAFQPSYAEIAKNFHSNPDKKIKVARINGDAERALASRFGITAYPTFFVIQGWKVYKFEEARSKKALQAFVEHGYKKSAEPIPFLMSPLGPMGLIQGAVMYGAHLIVDLFQWTQQTFQLSPMLAGTVLFGGLFLGSFVTIVFLAIVTTPNKSKRD